MRSISLARRDPLPYPALGRATLSAWRGARRLPPGALIRLDEAERADRRALLHLAGVHGPVFKGAMEGRLAICVVGAAAGRRLLRDHAAALRPVAIDVSALFPGRFLRAMDGETHRARRAALMRGLGALDVDALAPSLRAIAEDGLDAYADAPASGEDPYRRWSAALSGIASGMLVRMILGAAPGTPAFARLMAGFRALGPNGVAWHVGPPQIAAFAGISALLRGDGAMSEGGLLGRIAAQGPVDDTLLGNLIYMVELGRYDLRGLLRWISVYAAAEPGWMARIAAADPARADALAEAFVREVLRLEQSERLMRDVLADIAFDGFLIPRGALLRICMWEAHKDPAAFERPFAFDPGRFLDGAGGHGARFSPFGLDHHLCPFAGLSTRLAAIALIALARGHAVTAQGGAPAVRGPYHWEPAPDLSVTLTKKDLR